MNKKRTILEKKKYDSKSVLVVYVETLKSLAVVENNLSALWIYMGSEY